MAWPAACGCFELVLKAGRGGHRRQAAGYDGDAARINETSTPPNNQSLRAGAGFNPDNSAVVKIGTVWIDGVGVADDNLTCLIKSNADRSDQIAAFRNDILKACPGVN